MKFSNRNVASILHQNGRQWTVALLLEFKFTAEVCKRREADRAACLMQMLILYSSR